MKQKIHKSLAAVRLSGPAKGTKVRICNFFQRKKHLPVMRLVSMALAVLLCGSLASCQPGQGESPDNAPADPQQENAENTAQPQIRMDVQDYGASGYLLDILEIPMLVMPDGETPDNGVKAINQALSGLKEEYQSSDYTQCILYPTETDRYINLLFFQTYLHTDLNTGHVFSLVYDKEEGRQVTVEDALTLAGLTEQELYDALSAQYDPQFAQQIPDAHIIIQNQALEGFRMDGDGQPIFYLTARSDDADNDVQDYVSGGENLYIWSDGQFTMYEQYEITVNDPYNFRVQPLVPTEETVKLDPPLWCQWYFDGGEPEGGFPTTENAPAAEPAENTENAEFPSVIPDAADVSPSPDQGNEDQTDTQPLKERTATDAYKAVLQGNMEFRDTLSGENFDISRVQELITPDTSFTIKPNYFSVVDLDADGTVEVILSLDVNGNGPGHYLVLRDQDDIVYGYLFAVREFNDIKADGTFWNTGGASDIGICRVTFDRDTYSIDRFAYNLYSPSTSGDGMSYFIDDQEVTEEEWDLAVSQWNESPYVEWYEFTDANIEAVLP